MYDVLDIIMVLGVQGIQAVQMILQTGDYLWFVLSEYHSNTVGDRPLSVVDGIFSEAGVSLSESKHEVRQA